MTKLELESRKKLRELNNYDNLVKMFTARYDLSKTYKEKEEILKEIEDIYSRMFNIKEWFKQAGIEITYIHNLERRYHYAV